MSGGNERKEKKNKKKEKSKEGIKGSMGMNGGSPESLLFLPDCESFH